MNSKKCVKCDKTYIWKVDVPLDILLKEIFYIFTYILLKSMSRWNFVDFFRNSVFIGIITEPTTIKTGKNKVKIGCF